MRDFANRESVSEIERKILGKDICRKFYNFG